jgi:putative membrane protein
MDGNAPAGAAPVKPANDSATELASRRTGMSFQRTRMSADRTLMSVIRTSLSLISFGFTIASFFGKLAEKQGWGSGPARNFGGALVVLGIGMLVLGLIYQLQFMRGLRSEREQLRSEGLVHAESHFPVSLTAIVAVLLLLVGLAAIVSLVFRVGPFV